MIAAESIQQGQIILINKPLQWSSFDVVKKMRSDIRHKLNIPIVKIGHAGSLDPLATGLLLVCLGKKATQQIESFQNLEKEYTGTIRLGATSPSYDLETEVNEAYTVEHITAELILETAKQFVGAVWQYPPIYSAKKVNGKRAYLIARSGGEAEIKPVLLQINKFEITNITLPTIAFNVICSKGTYIRSLAHDFGAQLKSGGLLTSLCRRRIGDHQLSNASELESWLERENIGIGIT